MKAMHVDVLIIGAGISGIGFGARLGQRRPQSSFAILEARDAVGGTWDLFRYPGIRSDSDVFTFSFPFRPWADPDTLAEGSKIREYIADTAREFDLDGRIHFGQKVIGAVFDSSTARWSVTAETVDGVVKHTASFVYFATGYYSYDTGHVVPFPGREDFDGPIIHPQFWPEAFDAKGKRIVVIGSGATAVTLIPALAEQGAAHVTMLQRSPSYILPIPASDLVGRLAMKVLPKARASRLIWRKNLLQNVALYEASRAFPAAVRRGIARLGAHYVGADTVREHLTPRYNPWDQRMCVVPGADFYTTIKSGAASIVTDTIEAITATGIRLSGGRHLDADAIVTATGLRLEIAGGIQVVVDGEPLVPQERYFYKGAMFEGVPNAAISLGYTNNSWTLRSDLTAQFVCDVLDRMEATGSHLVVPRVEGNIGQGDPPFGLESGYVQRARHLLPKQGEGAPWQVRQNYFHDRRMMAADRVDDGFLHFTSAPATVAPDRRGEPLAALDSTA